MTLDLILLAQFQLPIQMRPVAHTELKSPAIKSPATQSVRSFFDPNFPWSTLDAILTDIFNCKFPLYVWHLGNFTLLISRLVTGSCYNSLHRYTSSRIPLYLKWGWNAFHVCLGHHMDQTYLYSFSNEEKNTQSLKICFKNVLL